MACENGLLFFVQSLTCKPLLLPQTSNPPSQELNELMEYSAKFDIRPRRRFLLTALFLGLFCFILSCIAEEEKYGKYWQDFREFGLCS